MTQPDTVQLDERRAALPERYRLRGGDRQAVVMRQIELEPVFDPRTS
jgi:hypothetical protein